MILTLLTIGIVLIGGVLLLIHYLADDYNDSWWFASMIVIVISGICLLFCVGVISSKEVRVGSQIVRIEAMRETFKSARVDSNIHALELALIQQKVAERNEWIANAKYWAEHPLTNWFWSKRILEIEPIR